MQMCPSTSVEVYDLKGPLDIPWKDFDQAKAVLEAHQTVEGSRFDWKINAMSDGEKAGWELWERSSYLYFLVSLSTPNPFMEKGCDLTARDYEQSGEGGFDCGRSSQRRTASRQDVSFESAPHLYFLVGS